MMEGFMTLFSHGSASLNKKIIPICPTMHPKTNKECINQLEIPNTQYIYTLSSNHTKFLGHRLVLWEVGKCSVLKHHRICFSHNNALPGKSVFIISMPT